MYFNYLSSGSKDKLDISNLMFINPLKKKLFIEHLWVIYCYC